MQSEPYLLRVLLVEDDLDDVLLLRLMLGEPGLPNTELAHAASVGEAEKYLAHDVFDIILLDLGLPDAQGLGAVRRARAVAPHVPLVVLSGMDDESVAVQALQEGAQDFLVKGRIDSRALLRALRYAMETESRRPVSNQSDVASSEK